MENSVKDSFLNKESKRYIYTVAKSLIDILLTLIALPFALLIVFLFGVLIKIETPGPIFFFQERVGKNGKYFKVIKLRSMRVDAEKNGAQWATKNDPRVTKIGSFIRRTRIDELPQLINVLKGEMSFVGPRPERPFFTAKFNEEIPGFINRLSVKPGLTGWAQVNGGYDITPEEKLKLDIYYLNNKSLKLDMEILYKTIIVCLSGAGSR
ncbi:exopolysaccharide biosynthesis polyprenyl glycosylphosphotransferase [Bacillus sp. Marseille-Q1617]|uniref:sugar transferase n=1 Tax=Bacillus sp. Marseille-Q1617 TaxID=2736887 RepID=UPI0020CA55B3|nr:exopolysaccharide biosynthesis polyprenyl glycosylphosphotransferase [Bacillus sp. Marseille-Q1617]